MDESFQAILKNFFIQDILSIERKKERKKNVGVRQMVAVGFFPDLFFSLFEFIVFYLPT